ncbi:MAG: type I secretion system permease/ATPase [Rubrivivax sp.]|nr:type I secretion system permease/ATPase [Rubrivivax sp.]
MSEAIAPPVPAQAQPPPGEAGGWDLDNDALAHAVSWLTRHHGRERSAQSLLAGQPVRGRIGPDQALRVLREAGYTAGLVQRPLHELHHLLLPAVLLLKEGDACIVVARDPVDAARYDIVMPGPEHHACSASQAELETEYSGFALVATPQVNERPAARTASRGAGASDGIDGTGMHAAADALSDPTRHWLWGTLRRFTPYYRSALVAAFLSNVLMLVSGLATSVIYDKVIPHQAWVTLWAVATACLLAIVFDLVARQLRAYLIDMAGRKIDLILGSTLFRQTLNLRMEHRPDSAGAYAHHLAQVEQVRDFFASATLAAVSDLPFIVIFVAMTFIIGGPLGYVPALAVPLLLALSWLIQGSLRRAMSRHMAQTADLHGVLVEAVDGMEDIKAAGAQGRFLRRYEEATAAAAAAMLRSRSISAWTTNISTVSQQGVTVLILVWGVLLIDAKVVTAGALIGAVMFATRAVAPLMSVVQLATRYQGARAAMRALDRVMNQPVEREAGRAYVPRRELSGQLGLRDVGFAYPTPGFADREPGPKVLKGVTLAFQPGERVAVLGRIGSGKSTVLRLLAGLYQPTEGQVEADGIDLRQIDPADYRARVGFVAQDPRLFHGTLRDNVLLDRPAAEPGRLAEVARVTGLDRLVASHPQGWELPVGEAGALLSGGQRQLVALARCLVTHPQILLMDEPTSSMDAQSEVAFLRQLKEAMSASNCTLVMVTHRPAVLELVSRIVVVDAGRLVMDGPKAQVLAALSGAKPAAAPANAAAAAAPSNVHLHPNAQPVQRGASV